MSCIVVICLGKELKWKVENGNLIISSFTTTDEGLYTAVAGNSKFLVDISVSKISLCLGYILSTTLFLLMSSQYQSGLGRVNASLVYMSSQYQSGIGINAKNIFLS